MATVAVLAATDADPEQVRLEAVRQATTMNTHIIGDPDIQTTGTITANGETITLDGSGIALYTWPTQQPFVTTANIAAPLMPARVIR